MSTGAQLSADTPPLTGAAARGPRVVVDGNGRPAGRSAELAGALSAYQDTVVRMDALDAVTTELVRRRCARQHDCRICQSLRLISAMESGLDEDGIQDVDRFEDADFSEAHKVALRIVDAFIWHPANVDPELVAQARSHYTDRQLAELLVDISKWSTQKIHVALGTDGTDRVPLGPDGRAYFTFADSGAVATMSPVRPGSHQV